MSTVPPPDGPEVRVVIDSPGVVCGGCGITIHDIPRDVVQCMICGHKTPLKIYTADDISTALNKAADDIIEATEAEDEGLRDALNLMVNAVGSYLWDGSEDLEQVAVKNYDADLDSIVGWIQQGIR
jgi:hypothetical protein